MVGVIAEEAVVVDVSAVVPVAEPSAVDPPELVVVTTVEVGDDGPFAVSTRDPQPSARNGPTTTSNSNTTEVRRFRTTTSVDGFFSHPRALGAHAIRTQYASKSRNSNVSKRNVSVSTCSEVDRNRRFKGDGMRSWRSRKPFTGTLALYPA